MLCGQCRRRPIDRTPRSVRNSGREKRRSIRNDGPAPSDIDVGRLRRPKTSSPGHAPKAGGRPVRHDPDLVGAPPTTADPRRIDRARRPSAEGHRRIATGGCAGVRQVVLARRMVDACFRRSGSASAPHQIMRISKAGPTNDALRARPPSGYLRAIGLACSRPGLKQDASSKRCSGPDAGKERL